MPEPRFTVASSDDLATDEAKDVFVAELLGITLDELHAADEEWTDDGVTDCEDYLL